MKKKATNLPQENEAAGTKPEQAVEQAEEAEEKAEENVAEAETNAEKESSVTVSFSKLSPKKTTVFAAASAIFVILYLLIINKLTICDKGISPLSLILVIAVCFGGFVLPDIFDSKKLKRFLKGTAAACLIAFGAETFVFNLKSIASGNEIIDLGGFSGITSNSELTVIENDSVTVNENAEIYIDLEKTDIKALKLRFSGESDTSFQCALAMKDDNFAYEYVPVGDRTVPVNKGYCEFSFVPYETLHSVRITFTNFQAPLTISGLDFSKALPFRFSEIRFYFVFFILALISFIRCFELYKVNYNRKDPWHKAVIVALTVICSLSMLSFVDPVAEDIEYDPELTYSWENPFVQMFSAFQKGQVNIDIEPSPELLDMENPYDYSARVEFGVPCAWDRAYYNGKYYSYYGVAPVISFYYPYYYLTNKLPSINKASIFFGIICVIAQFGAIMAFIRKFIEKPNFLLVAATLIASHFATGTLIIVNDSSMYALPGITGNAYLMLCLWSGFEACIRRGEKKQPVLFALCGIAFAFALASKPTRALSCLVLAPIFLEFLFTKDIKIKTKVTAVASFMLPVIAGCGAIMAYNNARFDSPFEFGAVYQLTVSNAQAGNLKLSYLPHAIIHYFFQPIRMAGAFPFVEVAGAMLANRQSYVYSDFAAGALSIPLIAAGFIAFPFLMQSFKRKKYERFKFDTLNVKKTTYVFMLLMSLFLAWFSYCVAGIIMSYVCDIMPLLTLLSVLVLLDTQKQLESCKEVSSKSVCLFTAVAAATVIVMGLELISFRNTSIHRVMPNLLFDLEEIMSFWN